MRVVLFCHSLISDWNHGNAHFLRGIVAELQARGVEVRVFDPADAWSVVNLLEHGGQEAIDGFHRAYPQLTSTRVAPAALDLDAALDGADVVIVHDDHPLVERIGRHRSRGGDYLLLFHDTHHRSVSDEAVMAAYDLQHYDAVLAFGGLSGIGMWRGAGRGGRSRGTRRRTCACSARRAFTAVSTTPSQEPAGEATWDVVWIGNWGDEERSREIRDFLIGPVRASNARARVHGVRCPAEALRELREAGIDHAGWLPNYRVPAAFGQARATLHIPRRPYVETLPGVPTIRVFEALACGIPLVSCWWDDREGLFQPGRDYLVARTPGDMTQALRLLRADPAAGAEIAASGLRRVRERHTCAHRVDELFGIMRMVLEDAGVEAART